MFKALKRKAMMMGVSAGPFFGGLIIGIIIGIVVLYIMFSRGIFTCPGAGGA